MRRGVDEISSVVMRLENRKKYPKVKKFFEDYPYTTTSKVNEVIKKHDYLKIGQIAQFSYRTSSQGSHAHRHLTALKIQHIKKNVYLIYQERETQFVTIAVMNHLLLELPLQIAAWCVKWHHN